MSEGLKWEPHVCPRICKKQGVAGGGEGRRQKLKSEGWGTPLEVLGGGFGFTLSEVKPLGV